MTNPNQEMSLERLSALLDRYGADLARLPLAERAQAEALLARSEAAQKVWREAAELDGLLAEKPASLAPSAALMRRLDAIPAREPQVSNVVRLPRRASAWASLAAAAALFLGIFTGSQQEDDSSDTTSDGVAQVQQSDDAASLSEFAALALGGELVTDLGQVEGDAE